MLLNVIRASNDLPTCPPLLPIRSGQMDTPILPVDAITPNGLAVSVMHLYLSLSLLPFPLHSVLEVSRGRSIRNPFVDAL
jgi:hypothetical protein